MTARHERVLRLRPSNASVERVHPQRPRAGTPARLLPRLALEVRQRLLELALEVRREVLLFGQRAAQVRGAGVDVRQQLLLKLGDPIERDVVEVAVRGGVDHDYLL